MVLSPISEPISWNCPKISNPWLGPTRVHKNHISRYGSIEIDQLYEPPFTTLHSDGLDGVFIDEDMVEELIRIIDTFRPKATVPTERPYGIH